MRYFFLPFFILFAQAHVYSANIRPSLTCPILLMPKWLGYMPADLIVKPPPFARSLKDREAFSMHYDLAHYLKKTPNDLSPLHNHWVDLVTRQDPQQVLVADINVGFPTIFEVPGAMGHNVKVESFPQNDMLKEFSNVSTSKDFQSSYALNLGLLFGIERPSFTNYDTDIAELTQTVIRKLDDLKIAGKFIQKQTHGLGIKLPDMLAREGQKYDMALCFNLAWYRDRIAVLQAIQHSLKPDGKAFVLTSTYEAKAGTLYRRNLFTDRVEMTLEVLGEPVLGYQRSLVDYLVSNYPDYFEKWSDRYFELLIVKGNSQPLVIPEIYWVTDTHRHTSDGLPVFSWHFAY